MTARTPAATRARRMLAILPYLTPEAAIPLANIAHALGVSPEDLAADIGTLSLCGAAPYTPDAMIEAFVEDDGVVHTYQPLPALDRPVRLTPAEARALAAALELAGASPDEPLVTRLMAAAATAPDPETSAPIVRTAAAPGGPLAVYERVASAIERREKLRVVYWTASRGEETDRTLHPWSLGFDKGAWYVRAYCELREEPRTFRLDRVLAAEPTGEAYATEPDDDIPAPAFAGEDMPRAELLFEEGAAAPALGDERDWPGATFERLDDGTVRASVPYTSPGWLARRVAARFGSVRVIEPPQLREAVRSLASHAAD